FMDFEDRILKPEFNALVKPLTVSFRELTASSIQQYRLRYILAKLTQYIEQQAWGNQNDRLSSYLDRSVHVEHILPQKPSLELRSSFDKPEEYDVYSDKLGNLALLEKPINTSLGNGTFEEKKREYPKSRFLLTRCLVMQPQVGLNTAVNRAVRDFSPFESWGSREIELRQETLGGLALKVWDLAQTG
ncbi:MAG: HNH endonuclease family protein, partial [Bacillota bacterium]